MLELLLLTKGPVSLLKQLQPLVAQDLDQSLPHPHRRSIQHLRVHPHLRVHQRVCQRLVLRRLRRLRGKKRSFWRDLLDLLQSLSRLRGQDIRRDLQDLLQSLCPAMQAARLQALRRSTSS